MNWNAVAAIAEMLGAIGVLATLVYLTAQIRANTRALRAATAKDAVAAVRSLNMPMIQDAALARAFRVGVEGLEGLDDDERARFLHWVFNLFRTLEDLHYQYLTGTLEEETWNSWIRFWSIYLLSPGFRAYWSVRGHTFTPAFQQLYATLESSHGDMDAPRMEALVAETFRGPGSRDDNDS